MLAQPMVWLLLFGHLFTKMPVPGGNYLRFMTAGAVVMTTFNGCLTGGVELLFDRESGFLVRMLAAPASRVSLVTSRFIYLTVLTGAGNAAGLRRRCFARLRRMLHGRRHRRHPPRDALEPRGLSPPSPRMVTGGAVEKGAAR
jgi:hypothetical protein